MTKTGGLGDNLLVAGYNLSGDTGSLEKISGGHGLWEVTGIDKSGVERIGLLRDGAMSFTSFFNPSSNQAHPVLSALPTTDVAVAYLRGTTLGSHAAAMIAKQVNYDGKRADSGAFTFSIDAAANGYGLEWGVQLTAGERTDTGATNGTGVDLVASTSFGWQAYLQVSAFTGTDVTITLQDSANNSAFAGFTGSAFTATTAARTTQRLASATPTATVRQYLRAITTTSAGFTSVTFTVVFVKNQTTVVF